MSEYFYLKNPVHAGFVRQMIDIDPNLNYNQSTMSKLLKTVSARNMQRDYKEVAKQVAKADQPVVVMNRNQPQFALLSLKLLEKYQRMEDFAVIEEVWAQNRNVNFDEAFKIITQEVELVRQENYESKKV